MKTTEQFPQLNFVTNPSEIDLEQVSQLLNIVGMRARKRDAMARAIAASAETIAVYGEEGHLIGFGRLISDGVFYGTLWDIAVHPDFQKMGVGTGIVARLLDTCRRLELRMVGLFTGSHNRKFYEGAGFVTLDDIHAMTLDLHQFQH